MCEHITSLLDNAKNKIIKLDKDFDQALQERDYWEGKATELAESVGNALGIDVGEHTNLNCPVQNAIDGVFEMGAQIHELQKASRDKT